MQPYHEGMDRQPNHEDAILILRLYELRRDERLREARDWFARNFNATTLHAYETLCPPGSEPNAFTRMVTSYWDMVASFVTNGVLHDELFFQSGREMLLVWERMAAAYLDFKQVFRPEAAQGRAAFLVLLELSMGRVRARTKKQRSVLSIEEFKFLCARWEVFGPQPPQGIGQIH